MSGNHVERAERLALASAVKATVDILHEGGVSRTTMVIPKNLSDSGVAFQIDTRLDVGTRVLIAIGGTTGQLLAVNGTVVRCECDETGAFVCGVSLDTRVDASNMLPRN